ncbi:hypothetical protein [Phenylobacterium sp.]|uniref:hypothetical protein n=1 Tax=Phenylobacterium sp. TaxID=1871053 RepID=UPI002735AF8B|nr:hypothetical protein [Phenylobacterium sp.]MDP3853696.1 hypothetical protein [Phenylobacterium sp.]
MRRRSAVLEALELLRERAPTLSLAQIMVFLYVADEDEALPLLDLQRRAEMSAVQAWRNVRALAGEDLVQVRRWKMGSITAAELTPAGRDLAARLDAMIADASPIAASSRVAA